MSTVTRVDLLSAGPFGAGTVWRETRGGTMATAVQDGSPTAPAGRLLALIFGGLAARTVEGALRRDLDDLAAAA